MPIIEVCTPDRLPTVRELFIEYVKVIAVDLCFQDFDRELADFFGRYAPLAGSLLLALDGADVAGCVALRKIGDGICEMKRFYVRSAFRGKGLGCVLVSDVIVVARQIGYERMCLDMLSSMKAAIVLY